MMATNDFQIQQNQLRESLEYSQDWQTKARGTNSQEYEIYKSCAEDLGWQVKTYEEWIGS